MDVGIEMTKLTDDLAEGALHRVKRMRKDEGVQVHVVVIAFECKPPNGEIGHVKATATFTDVEGLHTAAALMHDLYVRKKGN